MMKNVAIYRHQLFKGSEPFIAMQASGLREYYPIYTGRSAYGVPPSEAEYYEVYDGKGLTGRMSRVWQVATRYPSKYSRLLRSKKIDLIHAHFGVEGVYALPIAKNIGIPLITTFHGFDATLSVKSLLGSGKLSWLNYIIHRRKLAAEGDYFLCVSEYIRQRVLELGFPEEKTQVHYIGIDTQNITPNPEKSDRPTLVHVARLVEKKGTEFLIKAFAAVASELPDLQLSVIGDGELRSKLESLVGELGLGSRVQFSGALPHDKVIAHIREASVLMLPSVTAASGDAEGLPTVLLEAAAAGVPVIGTRHGGIPEAIDDGVIGYLVPERDVTVLAARIRDLMSDKDKLQQMGANARAMVENRFDIRKQTEKLENIYDRLVH